MVSKIKNVFLVILLLNAIAAVIVLETALTTASFKTIDFKVTCIELGKLVEYFNKLPTTAIVFKTTVFKTGDSSKQVDNFLIVKAQNNDVDGAILPHLNF